jgi:hypothetical protein
LLIPSRSPLQVAEREVVRTLRYAQRIGLTRPLTQVLVTAAFRHAYTVQAQRNGWAEAPLVLTGDYIPASLR